jgi:hypothetical protein
LGKTLFTFFVIVNFFRFKELSKVLQYWVVLDLCTYSKTIERSASTFSAFSEVLGFYVKGISYLISHFSAGGPALGVLLGTVGAVAGAIGGGEAALGAAGDTFGGGVDNFPDAESHWWNPHD